MGITMCIRDVDPEVKLKMRILSLGRGKTMPQLLKEIIEKEYDHDTTLISPQARRKLKRLIKRSKP